MHRLNVLLSVLISVALALFVLEVGLRVAGFGFPETLNEFDAELGWSKVPGKVVESSSGDDTVTIEINELGLRDDPMSAPGKSEPNVFRVLFLGDSFTLGSTVERNDLFVDILEHWWHLEERRADAINAGTEGWSTDQEARWFELHGADYEPDLVVLLPYENDLYWCAHESYFGKDKPRYRADGTLEPATLEAPPERGALAKSAILRFLGGLKGSGAGPHRFTPPGGSKRILAEFAALIPEPGDLLGAVMPDAEARAKGSLLALHRAVDEAGAELVVVPIPSQSAVDEEFAARFGETVLGLPRDAWDPNRPVDLYLEFARELGVDAVDVREPLRDAVAAGERLYHRRDWHLNPAGNRVLAQALHDELDRVGAVPAEHQALSEVALPALPHDRGLPTWVYVWLTLWIALSVLYAFHYRDEPLWRVPLQVGALLAMIFAIVLGGGALLALLPPTVAMAAGWIFVLAIIGFVVYKLGRRVGTITELLGAFTRRGHWYLMPLVVVLLTIGSLLVVAASSPLVAPFIYTLF